MKVSWIATSLAHAGALVLYLERHIVVFIVYRQICMIDLTKCALSWSTVQKGLVCELLNITCLIEYIYTNSCKSDIDRSLSKPQALCRYMCYLAAETTAMDLVEWFGRNQIMISIVCVDICDVYLHRVSDGCGWMCSCHMVCWLHQGHSYVKIMVFLIMNPSKAMLLPSLHLAKRLENATEYCCWYTYVCYIIMIHG